MAALVLRAPRLWGWLLTGALVVATLPVLIAGGVAGLLSSEAQRACSKEAINSAAGALANGLYAAPLALRPGRWYLVGATTYGGPGDPTSGEYGSIPEPGQSYLPAHPDSFAELSLLRANPANGDTFTFAGANALGNLPYLTALRVAHAGHQQVLYKRDIGYGQGPGQRIANGQPYRIDVWWQAASSLSVSKDAVSVALAPASGAAATLGALPRSAEADPRDQANVTSACAGEPGLSRASLPLVAGAQTKLLPSGLAAAGEDAPHAVKQMVGAGNRLFGTAYLYGGAHGSSLETLQGAYDCSSAVSYVLHWGGVLGAIALDSGALAGYGLPGPGRYVSIYANAAHAFVYIAGLRLDTVHDRAYDSGPNASRPGAHWRVSAAVPDWAAWSVRHPRGL